jgi:pimeloyl-ACP methyl ester carboxylesterase
MTSFAHDTAPTQYAEAGGTHFAYRRFGSPGRPPLVFFQHFMGNLDEVILFDNSGVASSSGIVPDTIEAMARASTQRCSPATRAPSSTTSRSG